MVLSVSKPALVDTDTACVFIIRVREQHKTDETMTAARQHVYYLAKTGRLTRHGGSKRGQARWDLRELARPYRNTVIVTP